MARPGRVTVTFGAPLSLEGQDYSSLAKQVEEAVMWTFVQSVDIARDGDADMVGPVSARWQTDVVELRIAPVGAVVCRLLASFWHGHSV